MRTSAAKAGKINKPESASLKRCPDTNRSARTLLAQSANPRRSQRFKPSDRAEIAENCREFAENNYATLGRNSTFFVVIVS